MATTLREHLDRLHAELKSNPTLDRETRLSLERVARDIEEALEGSADAHTVRGRIEDAAVRFEAEHPRFALMLSEVTDALAKIGV